MHFASLISSGLALLAATAYARPTPASATTHNKMFAGNPFEITNLKVDRVESANVTMSFTVHNPDPLANSTTECTQSWAYGSKGWPNGIYEPCSTGAFAWNMKDFTSWSEGFVIEVKDSFKDPSVGDPPYDRVTIFGTANFDQDVVTCTPNDEGETCSQGKGTVTAPIDRTVAKR